MKILKFKAINYKGIKELEIIPDGNLVIISGKNGAGKSSTLDGIKNILAGKNKIIKQPIREGEDKAELEMEIEGRNEHGNEVKFKIKKVITENGETLQIINEDGLKYPNPQSFLKKITGNKSFDPNEFLNKNEKEQKEDLVEFSGINLDEEDNKLKEIYELRHQTGIEGKTLAQYTNEEIINAKKYENKEEINITDVSSKLENEQRKHREYNNYQESIKNNENEIELLKEKIKDLELKNEESKKFEKPKSNIEEIKKELDTADEENKKIRESKQILESNKKVKEKKQQWSKLDNDYKEQQSKRQQLLSTMKLPLEGLEVNENGIKFNNIPIKQLSTSEGLKIAIAIYIETCIKEGIKLQLCTIKNGNDFDDESIKILAQIIDGYDDLTVFLERVVNNKDESVGIYIEDGKIINKE